MRWSYLCTVGRCAHYTYSICMKLDMLLSKNVVVFTRKVLFVNLVLCWRAVSWGQNPSCNFTLDHAPWLFLFFWNNICHFHDLEMLKRAGERGRDAQVVLSCCWESNMQNILGSHLAQPHPQKASFFEEESVKREWGSFSWKTKQALTDQCVFPVHHMAQKVLNHCPLRVKFWIRKTEMNYRPPPSLQYAPNLSTSCYVACTSLGNLTGNPCLEPLSCHTRFDTLTWRCKHSFYLDLYLSFDLLHVLLPIECMLLIAVSSHLKRAFVLTLFIFWGGVSFYFFFFSFSWSHDWCVQYETVLCATCGHYSPADISFISG